MAINNPYIPGDPYSYDLKWIVAKIKEILQQLGTLDTTISQEIIVQLQENAIAKYLTVADMLAADIADGSLVLTMGYYEPGDMGGTFYLIKDFNPSMCQLDYFLTMDNNSQIAVPVIMSDYITPEMFGAKTDGTDAVEAMQQAVDHAYADGRYVLLTGEYAVSEPLKLYGGANNTMPGTTIKGTERGSVKITALASMTSVLTATSESADCANIYIEHMQIDAADLAQHGVYFEKPTANSKLYDLKINHALGWGVDAAADFYLSTIEKVRVDNSANGIKLTGGTQTSLRLVDCYIQNAENAYYVESIYSTFENCCADGITDTVFKIPHFTGTLVACGTEARNAETVFEGGNNTFATIVNPLTWSLTKATGIQIKAGPGAQFNVVGGFLSYSPTNQTAPGKLYQLALEANIHFHNVKFGAFTLNNGYSNITSRASFEVVGGSVSSRYDERIAYIGVDTQQSGGLVNPEGPSTMRANAIYMGLDDRTHTMAGANIAQIDPNMKGDILISQDPVKYGCIGWVQVADTTQLTNPKWQDGTYKKIPINMSGTTAQRPTYYTTDTGLMYFDTTLNKPIWWTGGAGRDAAGNAV